MSTGLPIRIVGTDGKATLLTAQVLKHHDDDHAGLVVLTDRLLEFTPLTRFFLNDTFGSAMNQNIGFSGTPEIIHNGGTSTEWTGSAIQGTWNFADGGTVSLTAANNNDAATFSEETPTTINMSGFTTLTGKINLTIYNGLNNTLTVIFDNGGMPVGNSVNLNDYINTDLIGAEQTFIVPKADLGLTTQLVDGFTILLNRTGGVKPTIVFDDIQLEQTGDSAVFKLSIVQGEHYHIDSIRFTFIDDITGITTVSGATENATMVNLSYNKLLGLTALANGMIFQRVQDGKPQFSTTLKTLSDFLTTGGIIVNVMGDGTNAYVSVDINFKEPIILKGDPDDNFLSISVNDNQSELIGMTAVARGATEI